MDRTCSTNKEKRNAYSTLVGNPKGKGPLRRTRHGCADNIKMVLEK
jgi:hypothetical protein